MNDIDLKDQFVMALLNGMCVDDMHVDHYCFLIKSAYDCAEFMLEERQRRINLASLKVHV